MQKNVRVKAASSSAPPLLAQSHAAGPHRIRKNVSVRDEKAAPSCDRSTRSTQPALQGKQLSAFSRGVVKSVRTAMRQ